jgi:hypothetical protein
VVVNEDEGDQAGDDEVCGERSPQHEEEASPGEGVDPAEQRDGGEGKDAAGSD